MCNCIIKVATFEAKFSQMRDEKKCRILQEPTDKPSLLERTIQTHQFKSGST